MSKLEDYYIFPLGLAYISASLKNNGYSVECLNLNSFTQSPSVLLAEQIIKKEIDVVCTGGLSAHYSNVKAVIDISKKTKPDIITVIGGGVLSSEPELILNALDASYGVIGEGEETVVELAHALSTSQNYEDIKGLIYRKQDKSIKVNAPRAPIEDLDRIPTPDYDGFQFREYLDMRLPNDERFLYPFDQPRLLFMISSRSCPYSCTFCYHPLGKKYRQRSLDSLFSEMESCIQKYGINIFFIMDELFSLDPQRVVEFCRRIKPLNVKWLVQIRVDTVNKDMLDSMKDAGCYCISYGLESGSDTVLKSMQKHITVAQIMKALDLTYQVGIGVQGNFIFGDPAETFETATETFNLWLKLRKHNIYMGPIETYPGTPIYERAVTRNIITDKLSFIASGQYSLNLTSLSDNNYFRVLLLMNLLRQSYQPIPANILSCKLEGRHAMRGPVYTVRIVCPHCGETVEYRNMLILGYPKLGCKQCNQRFDLASLEQCSDWPVNYVLSSQNALPEENKEELKRFLETDSTLWPEATGILDETQTSSLKVYKVLGKYLFFPLKMPRSAKSLRLVKFQVVDLFNKSYLVHSPMEPEYLIDAGKGIAERIVTV